MRLWCSSIQDENKKKITFGHEVKHHIRSLNDCNAELVDIPINRSSTAKNH